MNCRDVRDIADSFLSEELLTETNHDILRHLDTCPSCRTELDARRRLRSALRSAFHQSADLAAPADFSQRLREQLLHASAQRASVWTRSRGWLALAAGLVLAAVLAGSVWLNQSAPAADALARDAVGDHKNCALDFRLESRPVRLGPAAQQFDSAYRVLLTTPPDDVTTPDGLAHVVERHSCAFNGRRFGHVVMTYRNRVVSLLMTANDGLTGNPEQVGIAGARRMDGMSVVRVNGTHHAVFLVSDLDSGELEQLSKLVSVPLTQHLEVSLAPDRGTFASLHFEPRIIR